MGYRISEKTPRIPRRDVQATASPSTVFVQNGTVFEYAIPCWYLTIDEPLRSHCHSRQMHDHLGWPNPGHPDHICQDWEFASCHHRHDMCAEDWERIHSCHSFEVGDRRHDRCHAYLDMRRLSPIHLSKEGYRSIEVAFDGRPNGLNVEGRIDEDRDWIVRITVDALVGDAVKERVEVPYSVFASGRVLGQDRRDVVSRGVMVILPGPIGA